MTSLAPHRISVIVPENPFAKENDKNKHCLCAIDVEKLMEWWPGNPHYPEKRAEKVRSIQRSLDWKRVAQIAAYLLQQEIKDAPDRLIKYFEGIYQPKKNEPGRQWPPKIGKIIGFERSVYPTFSNVLIHVNGATIENLKLESKVEQGAARLEFDDRNAKFNLSVIDGQHRINGAYFAIQILKESSAEKRWEIPAEVFLDLDDIGNPPTKQAQIFIDVNFYQKRVDRSLVADLFPTARGQRDSLDRKERSQDIGRKLMLEIGPLVGMIQIPGIKFGVKDVISLATLNNAIEEAVEIMEHQDIVGLEMQTEFLAQALTAWTEASGRFERKPSKIESIELDSENVAYQGRILVSIINLVPAMLWKLKSKRVKVVSEKALEVLTEMFREIATKANLLHHGVFISKAQFKQKGYVGSGGIGRFRDSLWAALDSPKNITGIKPDKIAIMAIESRGRVYKALNFEKNA